MPIVVACPGCPTKLSAPDTAAGKQIRCPKCGATAPVPAFIPAEEVPVVDAKVTAPAPKPKPAAADTTSTVCIGCNSMVMVIGKITDGMIHCPKCGFANPVRNRPDKSADDDEDDRPRKKAKSRRDDDDEDDDDRPRKKKRARAADDDDDYDHDRPRHKRRKAGGGSGGKIALVVCGGLFLLVLVGVGIYFLTGKSSPFAKKTPVPAGWVQHTSPHNGFKAYFPKEPQEFTVNGGFPLGGGFGGGRFGGRGGFAGANELADVTSVSSYTSGGGDSPIVTVTVARFRGDVPAALRDQVRNTRTGNEFGIETRKVRWLGYDAGEAITGNTLSRVVYTDKQLIVVQITGPRGLRAKPEEEAGFFDNFELTK